VLAEAQGMIMVGNANNALTVSSLKIPGFTPPSPGPATPTPPPAAPTPVPGPAGSKYKCGKQTTVAQTHRPLDPPRATHNCPDWSTGVPTCKADAAGWETQTQCTGTCHN
jgi:hypothetical protein